MHNQKQIVYNSLMNPRKRYTNKIISAKEIESLRSSFAKKAGQSLKLLIEFLEGIPNVALVIKDANGRIMHMNEYNAQISGWASRDETYGYTSEDLYPPDQAAVYANRDREVMETGIPIVNRIYGFVADRSTNLNCVTVRPIESPTGERVGTATVYYRAQEKMRVKNWYDPIRQSIAHLNNHYTESISIEQLAKASHYSVAQFRKLFCELTQMTPSDYIAQIRINAAKTLLLTTNKRICDIALEIGFWDHSHFIRTFHKATGMTPRKFRQTISS